VIRDQRREHPIKRLRLAKFRDLIWLLPMPLHRPLATLIFSSLTAAIAFSNTPQAGFNLAESDAKAIEIAAATMAAMGGRDAWDAERHVTWRFFGMRLHVWDKFTGNHRYETENLTVLSNLNTGKGRAWREGTEITDAEELAEAINQAEGAWINDSYWLVMPFKLLDTGVTLKYVGQQDDPSGNVCDVLELTFQEVGRTPDNKYHVFVDRKTKLVTHWLFWRSYADEKSRDLGPWTDYQRHGEVLIAHGHGENRGHTDIAIFDELPESVYSDPAPFAIGDHL